ncbi:C39 family peptidase [Coraliomargarita parva]|uniref:C39 family peptidase n=1 Tax=Coraliomargarita parva TaxID=3014050 RepID=UPI0022B3506D|nr:C39 family peptidase [Coraliomargarita parva]
MKKLAKLFDVSGATGIRAVVDPLVHPKRPRCKTLKIPGYKQVQGYTCGFIAAANILHFFTPDAELEYLYEALDIKDGTTEDEVTDALRQYGIRVRRRTTLDFKSIQAALQSGLPIITSVKAMFSGHWVVIYGYDNARKTVFVCGNGILPLFNRKEVSYGSFCEKWDPVGNGLICSPGTLKQPKLRGKRRKVKIK